jgi:hypothetical protein
MRSIKTLAIIFILLTICCNNKPTIRNSNKITIDKEDTEWDIAVKERIFFAYFNPVNYTFKNKKGSEKYILKYNLTDIDIKIIGSWYPYALTGYYNVNHQGPGIAINFLPNRFLIIFQNNNARRDMYTHDYYIVGKWKIENNKIYCLLEYKIEINDLTLELNIEKQNFSNNYVKIFEIENYKYAYVNKNPFEFKNFNDDIKSFFNINDLDTPRFKNNSSYRLGCFLPK